MQLFSSVIYLNISVQGFIRRASVASDKKSLGIEDFGNVQGEIGAPYRDMTQIVGSMHSFGLNCCRE